MKRLAIVVMVASAGCFAKPDPPAGTPSCSSYGAFGAPVAVAGVNTVMDERAPWLSPDGLDLWFSRGMTAPGRLFAAHRPDTQSAFGAPTEVTSLITGDIDPVAEVFISDDGLRIWFNHFQSTVVIATGARDTPSGPFTDTGYLNIADNGGFNLGDPTLSSDGLTMVVSKWQNTSDPADLWITSRGVDAGDFAAPHRLTELATAADECCASLSGDALQLYFASDRNGQSTRLYSTQRATAQVAAAFAAPVLVALQPPDPANNTEPLLSRDGLELLFASDVNAGQGFDLFEMRRTCAD